MKPPKPLNAIVDKVLSYKPKPKSRAAKKRKRRAVARSRVSQDVMVVPEHIGAPKRPRQHIAGLTHYYIDEKEVPEREYFRMFPSAKPKQKKRKRRPRNMLTEEID